MKNLSVKKLFVPTVYLVAVLSVVGCVFLTIYSLNNYLTEKSDFNYTVNGLLKDDTVPVQGEDSVKNEVTIIRPYISDKVTVGRYFYDFEGEEKKQVESIIFYENTYMQNSGVDYISETTFDVISVLSGKILAVETDETLGNIIKIQHDKDIISVYQGIDKIALKEGDTVNQGQIIGTSGTSSINSKYTTSLHFEVYYKGELIDPESFYTLNINDL